MNWDDKFKSLSDAERKRAEENAEKQARIETARANSDKAASDALNNIVIPCIQEFASDAKKYGYSAEVEPKSVMHGGGPLAGQTLTNAATLRLSRGGKMIPLYQLMITHVPGDENFTFSLSQSGSPHNSTANQAIAETDVIFVDSWLERLLEQFSGNS